MRRRFTKYPSNYVRADSFNWTSNLPMGKYCKLREQILSGAAITRRDYDRLQIMLDNCEGVIAENPEGYDIEFAGDLAAEIRDLLSQAVVK